MSQLPYTGFTRSKLELYRAIINQEWVKDTAVLEIVRILSEAGCSIKRTRISTWIETEVRVGRFPRRKEPLVGRPKKNRSQPVSALPLPFNVDEFKEMENFLKILARQIRPEKLAVELAIPLKLGNPDYESYAKSLGKEGVSRLGKMDYILLGMYSLLLTMDTPQDDPKFLDRLCNGTERIRTRMCAVVAGDS